MPDVLRGKRVRRKFRYGFASVAAFATLSIRYALVQHFGIDLPPFIVFYPVILAVTLLAGLWPGILVAAFATATTHHEHYLKYGRLSTAGRTEAMAMVIFFLMGVFVSVVADRYRKLLRRDELRFRALFENMAEGLSYCKIILDEAGRPVDFLFLEQNQAFCEMTGLENPEGKRVSQLVPNIHEVNPELLEAYARVALTGKSERFEIYRKAPRDKWYLVVAYCPQAMHFVAVLQDITERKRAEEKIAHLASFPELNPSPLFETNLEGKVTYVNPSLIKMLRSHGELEADHPLLKDWLAVVAQLKEKNEEPLRREVVVDEVTLLQTIDYVAKFNVVRSYCADITGLKQAEEEAARLQEQLQQAQKLDAVGRLAGGIAHDFNNLLMVIMAQTELLSLEVSGAAARRTENVMKSAKRAAELTGQLLAFSRKQSTQPTETTMNRLVTGVSDMLQRLVGEHIDVQVALCDGPWTVKVDRPQFEQVVMNLVVNARDAMPSGGQLTIETDNVEVREEYIATHPLVPSGNYAMLAVSDSGMGMDAETQAHIFEPFFTTKESGRGTGLGLSMVYGIVRQAGGFIWVYSEMGKGSCFKIYLPKVESSEFEQIDESVPEVQPAKKRATILLVEDEDGLREAVGEFLQSGGHTVIPAGTLGEAYRAAMEHSGEIELMLTDVVLKGGNGKQLAERLAEQGCRFPVIYMSGYTPDAIVHHGVLDAETRFLQKPFSRGKLLEKVEEALTERG